MHSGTKVPNHPTQRRLITYSPRTAAGCGTSPVKPRSGGEGGRKFRSRNL